MIAPAMLFKNFLKPFKQTLDLLSFKMVVHVHSL